MIDSFFRDTETDGWRLPEAGSAFYDGVPAKRLLAFIVDSILIGIITIVLIPFTAFTAIFYLPLLAIVVGFLYRWLTLSSGSATWGMRLAAIEIRTFRGERLDPVTAFIHTAVFSLLLGMVIPCLVSAAMMLLTPRKQGLHDMLLGTAALRRAA